MKVYINEAHEIKDVEVNSLHDETLTEVIINDEGNPFIGWSKAKICCYKVDVVDGVVTMMTPYVDSRLLWHIDMLSKQTESVVTDNKLDSVLKQAKLDAVNNTDEQALEVKDLYPTWESYPEGHTFKKDERVLYEANDNLYKVLQEHAKQNTWNPIDAPSLFAKIAKEEIPDWEQPSSTNPYMKGDKVKHIEHIWESLVDNNVWEPSDSVPTLWEDLGAE